MTVQTECTYEPFGRVTLTGASNTSSYQYTGRENDGTGLYYYRARYYNPQLQRFISEDPIEFEGGDNNLYGYVRDNPINFVDPDGRFIRKIRRTIRNVGQDVLHPDNLRDLVRLTDFVLNILPASTVVAVFVDELRDPRDAGVSSFQEEWLIRSKRNRQYIDLANPFPLTTRVIDPNPPTGPIIKALPDKKTPSVMSGRKP